MTTYQIKKDKVSLLKALKEFIAEEIYRSSIDVNFEREVSQLLTEVTDKRRFRKLKVIRRELEQWIDEMELKK